MIKPRPQKEHKTYISGKVSGIPIYNIEKKFKKAERYLVSIGMVPINPIKNGLTEKHNEKEHLIKDLPLLLECNSIYILDNWFDSKNSKIELKIANEYGIKVIYESVSLKNAIKTEKIKEAISNVIGLEFEQYAVKSRKQNLVNTRFIFMHFCRKYENINSSEIGLILNKDHATVLHGLKTFENEMKYNAEFRENVRKINEILRE